MAKFDKDYYSFTTFDGATKEPPVNAAKNNTDVIAPEFKLYIEGVQVVFESISISQAYGAKPMADIQIPPESGLLDITKGYEPKVHIFYRDDNYGGDRLLFWGRIVSCSYSKSRQQGSTYITFHCEHKNTLLNQLTLDFTGWASPQNETQLDPNINQGVKPGAFNSNSMIIMAMAGVNGVSTFDQRITAQNAAANRLSPGNLPVDKLDIKLAPLEKRYWGMPGVAANLWNQLKKGAYLHQFDNIAMSKMYIPLFEEGLSFFRRMSGHPTLEAKLQTTKEPYCTIESNLVKIIVPPYCRTSMISAVQRELTVRNLSNMVGFSGELTSFDRLLGEFYFNNRYDIITLASPAEINVDPTKYVDEVNKAGVEKMAIETIVKPQIPFYYSPTCNVILPRMYTGIQVNQDIGAVPTRVTATHDAYPGEGETKMGVSFKGPPSFREAVALNSVLAKRDQLPSIVRTANGSMPNPLLTEPINLDISDTKGNSWFIPGKYEQGVGIRHQKIALPWWLVILASDKSSQGPQGNQEISPKLGSDEYNDMIAIAAEWESRYSNKITEEDGTVTNVPKPYKKGLNPFDPLNKNIFPHERVMYSSIDYEYSQRVAASRSGTIEALFNPYVIPGYPIDIIDDSPNHPSFHGFCTGVSHIITDRSVTTTISFVNAVSYAELSNYYIPPIPPFLSMALGMTNAEFDQEKYAQAKFGDTSVVKSTASVLIQNPKAKAQADQFYREVLGVGAAAPDDLLHFSSGRAYPLERKAGTLIPKVLPGEGMLPSIKPRQNSARIEDDYYTSVGNLRLVSRPIESKDSISNKFSYNFIDLNPLLYNDSFVNYVNPKLAQNFFLEPGASLFLDYMDTEDFIKN
jgi:hypothetical protein